MIKKIFIIKVLSSILVIFALIFLEKPVESSLNIKNQVSANQNALKSVAKESRDSLVSLLREKRLNVINNHRKKILSVEPFEKEILRIKLRREREHIYEKHAQLLINYSSISQNRITDNLLVGR